VNQAQACAAMRRTYLITYGSQLQFIFARLFPTYLGFEELRQLYQDLDGRWRNLYRWTDPLGGPVLSWPLEDAKTSRARFGLRSQHRFGPSVKNWTTMAGACSTPAAGPAPAADPLSAAEPVRAQSAVEPARATVTSWPGEYEYRRWSIGPDVRLADPGLIDERPLQPRRAPRGHTCYFEDPGFDAVLAELLRAGQCGHAQ
jgi:hypothetical protein